MITIILAGGLGSRMKSLLPKVLHIVDEYPMIYYVIQNAIQLGSTKILIVVGKYKNIIKEYIDKYFPNTDIIEYIFQETACGTGHAIQCCISYFEINNIPKSTNVLVLSGDVPLITIQTLQRLLIKPNTLLITNTENPFGCGRIIFDDEDKIVKIIEEKDCNERERQIQYINCGIYNITVNTLLNTVPYIKNLNKSSEYYLTDFVDLAITNHIDLYYYELPKPDLYQVININTTEDLVKANELFYTRSSAHK
jgi:bifunctional N-acetylglucosamine-1-phosphate-uridyltransferase/glucosamine-1-phosphate-acetyltransferase GlmU-like protein